MQEIRDEISELSNKLSALHNDHMKCKKGCSECCMEFKVLPVEYFSMLEELKENKKPFFKLQQEEDCGFLSDSSCNIYPSRPIICRTHGLPLLFMNQEGDAWELSACPLNFTNFDMFDQENTYPQDTFNSRLFVINKKFIAEYKAETFGEFDMISVNRLDLDLSID